MSFLKSNWIALLFLLLLFALFTADNIPMSPVQLDEEFDRAVLFNLDDGKEDYRNMEDGLWECSFIDGGDFSDFLSSFDGKNFASVSREYLDTTGDGQKELVQSSVFLKGNTCVVKQEIFQDEHKIWDSSFELDYADLDFYFPPGLEKNKEALFYLGLTFSPFADRPNGSDYMNYSHKLIRRYFEGQNQSDRQMFASDFSREIKFYRGYFIFKRSPGQEGIFMWNETDREFKRICNPFELSA